LFLLCVGEGKDAYNIHRRFLDMIHNTQKTLGLSPIQPYAYILSILGDTEHLERCFGCFYVQEEGAPGEKFVVPVDKDTTGDVVLKITPEDGKTPKVTKVQKKVCKKASKDKLLIFG